MMRHEVIQKNCICSIKGLSWASISPGALLLVAQPIYNKQKFSQDRDNMNKAHKAVLCVKFLAKNKRTHQQ